MRPAAAVTAAESKTDLARPRFPRRSTEDPQST